MCTKKYCWLFFVAASFLFALLLTFLLNKIDYFKHIHQLNQDKCKTIDLPLAVEDLEIFNHKYLLGGMGDLLTLNELKGIDAAKKGALVAWRLEDVDNSMHLVPLVNFPENVRFQAHGMYLEKESQTLFVLSHAYKYGGERVEVFRLSQQDNKVVANYMRSIKLPDEVNGMLNDLIVVGDYIYLTQYMPFPDSMEGRDHSLGTTLKRIYIHALLKTGDIWKCKNTRADNQKEEEADCVIEVKDLIGFEIGRAHV